MNNEEQFEYKLRTVRNASLSREEREEVKRGIRLFMALHPVRPTLLERFFGRVPRQGFAVSATRFRPALAGLLIVLLVGGGTSYAAADALPGDMLYPVKTGINENIQGALAFSEEAKATLHATLAVRRLEEAELLASEGRLSSEIRAEIESRFEEHAQEFETNAASLAGEDSKIEAASDAQSSMEASLKAHAAVLADLSFVSRKAEEDISPIVRVVEKRARSVESARIATERIISRKVGKGIETAATAKKRTAENEISRRVSSAPEAVATLSMEVSIETDTTSEEALHEFQAGSERFEEGKYGEAFTKFQGALRAVERAKLDNDVRKQLKIESGIAAPAATSPEEDGDKGEGEEDRPSKGNSIGPDAVTVPLPVHVGK